MHVIECPDKQANHLVFSIKKSSRIIAVFIGFIGFAALTGWIINNPFLKSVLPTFVSMKPNSAVCFILISISILFSGGSYSHKKKHTAISVTTAVLVMLTGLFTLWEYFFYWDLTVFDQFFFHDNTSSILTSHPGRMALSTALCFSIIGISQLLIRSENRFLLISAQILIIYVFLLSIVFFMGFFYGFNPFLLGPRYSSAMSLHETVLFISTTIAILNTWPDKGVMKELSSRELGGSMLRKLMPIALPFPLLIGFLRSLSINLGLFDEKQGVAFVSVINLAMFCILLFFFAIKLNRSETRKRIADKLLKSSESRYRRLFEAAHDGIMILDIKTGRIEDINPYMTKLLGIPKEVFLNRLVWDVEPFRGSIEVKDSFHKLQNENRILIDDLPLVTGEGRQIDVELTGNVYEENGNNVAQYSIRDITDRQRMENELRKSESYFRAVVENSFDGFVIMDANRVIRYISPSYSKIIGYQPQDMIGRHEHEFIHPEDRKFVETRVRALLGLPGTSTSIECRLHHKDSHYLWVETTAVNLLEDVNVRSIVLHIRDISERVIAENKLVQMNEQLEDKVQKTVSELREKDQMMLLQSRQAAMGEMLGNIAHQWRQPLNAVGILIQNLIEHEKAGDLDSAYLEKNVKKSMELILLMSRTIDDFRNFFKPNKSKTDFSLKTATENALSFVSASLNDHGIESSLICKDDIMVSGYPNEFSQVLLNIFNNTLDAVKERNTSKPRISVRVFREKERSVITITDNAGGFLQDVVQKIFEPFFTTKEGGGGIGLYMAKNIIEKNMGGKLTARNSGNGAEFRIEI